MKNTKIYLSLLIVIFSVVAAFGQTNKPQVLTVEQRAESQAKRTDDNPSAHRIYIVKRNGEQLLGNFISGDADSLNIQSGERTLSIKIAEIDRIHFDESADAARPQGAPGGELTYKGAGNSNSSGESATDSASLSQPVAPGKINGGVLNSKAKKLIAPEYPAAARAVRASGAVYVQITIDEQGNIVNAAAVSGHPLLRQAAEDAARQARFAPIVVSGQPVNITGFLVYNFVP